MWEMLSLVGMLRFAFAAAADVVDVLADEKTVWRRIKKLFIYLTLPALATSSLASVPNKLTSYLVSTRARSSLGSDAAQSNFPLHTTVR